MNPVTDHVYVIRVVVEDEGGPSKRCCQAICRETGSNDFVMPPDFESPDAQEVEVSAAPTSQEPEVDLGNSTEELEDNDSLLQSELLPTEIVENYKRGATKLRRELQAMDFAVHLWKLKSYDQHGVAIMKIFCGECNKDSGGTHYKKLGV